MFDWSLIQQETKVQDKIVVIVYLLLGCVSLYYLRVT